MNRPIFTRIASAIAIAGIALLSGCGHSNPDVQPSPAAPVAAVPAPAPVGPPIASLACLPITGQMQIPFTGTNIYFDWANVVGGLIPYSNQSVGQIVIGGGSAAAGMYQRNGSDGFITMNITPSQQAVLPTAPYPNYPSMSYYGSVLTYPSAFSNQQPTLANISGFVTVSALAQQELLSYYGNGYSGLTSGFTYPGTLPQLGTPIVGQQACVSGIAIDLGHSRQILYGGYVYLYLNNTQHGYQLYF